MGRLFQYGETPKPMDFVAPPVDPPDDPTLATTADRTWVSQYGITWTFDQAYPVGQFVNGDYFVVGDSVTVVNIDPLASVEYYSATYPDWARDGSTLDPPINTVYGFDSYCYGGSYYSSSRNVGMPGGSTLSASNPLVLSSGSSLLSYRSKSVPAAEPRPQGLDMAVLTVVSEAPVATQFRPCYVALANKPVYDAANIDWDKLTAAQVPALSSYPSLATAISRWERPHLYTTESLYATRTVPENNQPGYYQFYAQSNANALLTMLSSDYTVEELKPLVYGAIQAGIDVSAAMAAGLGNDAGAIDIGGNRHGWELGVMVAGWLLDSTLLSTWITRADEWSPFRVFRQHGLTDQDCLDHGVGFTSAEIGYPMFGREYKTWKDSPATGDHPPEAQWYYSYQQIHTAAAFSTAMLCWMMGINNDIPNTQLFDFIDRYVKADSVYGTGWGDPWGTHDGLQVGTTNKVYDAPRDAYFAYRANYGPIWSP